MTWRTISHQGRSWAVQPAAERKSSTADWQLIFGFRPAGPQGTVRTMWAPSPLTAADKASLLRQADLLTDGELVALLQDVADSHGG